MSQEGKSGKKVKIFKKLTRRIKNLKIGVLRIF